ncbi:hypothetical protein ADIARSV_3999 [Arcticibacter svalbardensis MN12-7]|uniref:O-antigen polysaccharide polymerase Wzy n=1 Tax=Arcticibacter svalbardensis MN12-7 TaxID=1150600 RepID=R9GMI1_9SPHI|nr:hypothetical protein [Arcticibacter svalbardensis]EOR92911.1 hypothetical protein ADIARSV_3999 [Arcticibacter svalbardensis MN12-7]
MNNVIDRVVARRLRTERRRAEIKVAEKNTFVIKLVKWSWVVLLVAAFLQALIFSTYANFIAIACVLTAWTITSKVFLQRDALKNYPLSSFLVIGFTSTQFYFPLLFTLLEGKPVVYNLELPLQVFFHSTAALVVLVTAHYVYRLLPVNTYRGNNSLLSRAGFFQPPSESQLWTMAAIGLAANIYVYLFSPTTATEVSGNVFDKAVFALLPFAYAPYFIPFASLFGSKKALTKNIVTFLVVYSIMLLIIGMARNTRGAFMVGFTAVGLSYLLGLLNGVFKTPVISYKIILLAGFGLWLLTGPLADLGTAMVIVRSQRADLSKAELVDMTLDAFSDKKAISLRRLNDNEAQGDWDERYLDNIFTARFANIKFNDASLVQANKIGSNNPAMRKFSIDYLWGALPSPVLKVLHPSLNKDNIYSLSFGDYIYSLAGAGTVVYGGFRSGHFAGTGMAAFGLWYLLILGIGIIPIYLLFDKLVFVRNDYGQSSSSLQHPKLCFSVCGLLVLTSIFQFLPTESVIGLGTFLLRGWFQMVLLYFVIYHFTRLLCKYVPALLSS